MDRSGCSPDNLSDVDNLQGISRTEHQKDGELVRKKKKTQQPIYKDQRSGV